MLLCVASLHGTWSPPALKRRTPHPSALILFPLADVLACGADEESPTPEACDDPVVDADEISAAPRADIEAEVVALTCSEGVVADQELYHRVSVDLAAIRAVEPALSEVVHFEVSLFENPRLLVLAESTEVAAQVLDDSYSAIRFLNEALGGGVRLGGLLGSDDWFDVQFSGVLDTHVLAQLYTSVDGIRSAVGDALGGDGSRVSVHVNGAHREYLFDERSGDCAAGCMTSHLWWWTIDGGDPPRLIDDWDAAPSGEPAPSEFDRIRFLCAKCGDGSLASTDVELECGDQLDDDCDGFVDCEDAGCNGVAPCAIEDCGNDLDDDGDGLVDCADTGCRFDPLCGAAACESHADRTWLNDSSIEPMRSALRAAAACAQEEPPLTDCVATGYSESLTAPCALCFGELAACALELCEGCESVDESCSACAQESCAKALAECADYTIAWR